MCCRILVILKQISTISMQIPSLVQIHCSYRPETKKDGWMDGQTDTNLNHNTLPLSCGGVLKCPETKIQEADLHHINTFTKFGEEPLK